MKRRVNVQETGTYVLMNNQITGSADEIHDVDYNVNGYSNNKVVANITTSFANDKIAPEVTALKTETLSYFQSLS